MQSLLLQLAGAAVISALLGVAAVNVFYPGDVVYSLVVGAGSATLAVGWHVIALL
jgi:hypothetical protein